MPDAQGRLYAYEIAARIGISASDWRARVSRGYAPKPADAVIRRGATRLTVVSVWDPAVIDEYLQERDARLAGRGEQPAPPSA